MGPKDAEGIAKSVDPDQTAPLALFAQAYRSKNLGSLRNLRWNCIQSFTETKHWGYM